MDNSTSRYYASALTHLYHKRSDDGQLRPTLDQARITETREFVDFAALAQFVLSDLRYPHKQTHKHETYSWVPAIFSASDHTITRRDGSPWTRHGRFRNGAAESSLSCFVADIDNANGHLSYLNFDGLSGRLKVVGDPQWFAYTSFSSSVFQPRFRLVVDTTRPITRAEALKVWAWMNEYVVGGQADSSIYDPGDHLFAPPYQSKIAVGGTGKLEVDAIIAEVDSNPLLHALHEELVKPIRVACGAVSAKEQEKVEHLLAQKNLTPSINIHNLRVYNPDWSAAYTSGASHWKAMRSILGKVWLRSGGSLTYGDMLHIALQIDQLAGGYFARKYGVDTLAERVRWTMTRHAPFEDPAVAAMAIQRANQATLASKMLAQWSPQKSN